MSDPPNRVPSLTLGEQIAEALTLGIFLQHTPPGSLLRESELIERFGVSRPSVREALTLLEEQGLVDVSARRGFTVVDYSPEELDILLRYHCAVFSLSCRLAAEVANKAAIDNILRAVDLLKRLAKSGDSMQEYELARLVCFDTVQRATGIANELNLRRKFVGRMRHPYSIAAVATPQLRIASANRWTTLAELIAAGDGVGAEAQFHAMVAATRPVILEACAAAAASKQDSAH